MGWTKRQFIEQALEEIGLSPITYELPPEQLASALRRLNSMMAEWNARGIRIGFPLSSSYSANDIDEQTGVPDAAYEAIVTNLALRVAPAYGKQVMPQTGVSAKSAYNVLLSLATMPVEQVLPSMPSGAGNKSWRDYGNPFTPVPVEPLLAGEDGPIEME